MNELARPMMVVIPQRSVWVRQIAAVYGLIAVYLGSERLLRQGTAWLNAFAGR